MTDPFYFSDGRLAYNVADLLELCQQDPDAGTSYLVKQDLERWLAYIGNYEVAECAANARQAELSDRQKLEEFLNKSRSITQEKAIPSAESETPSSQTATTDESVSDRPSSSPVTEADIEESKQLASLESTLTENSEESLETSTTPTSATKPSVERDRVLSQKESKLTARAYQSSPANTNTSEPRDEEKPSFFQVIAKFIVKILYRNKA